MGFSQVICFKNCQVGSKMEQTTYTPWPPNPSNPPPSGSFLPPRGSASLVLNGPAACCMVKFWDPFESLMLLGDAKLESNFTAVPLPRRKNEKCHLGSSSRIWLTYVDMSKMKHQTPNNQTCQYLSCACVCVYLVPVDFDMIHQALKYGSYLKPPAATHFDESWTLQTPHVGRRPWSRNIPCGSWRWGKVANSWQHSQEKWREYAFK